MIVYVLFWILLLGQGVICWWIWRWDGKLRTDMERSETRVAVKVKADLQDWFVSLGGAHFQAKLGMYAAPDCEHEWEDWPMDSKHCLKCGMVRQKI